MKNKKEIKINKFLLSVLGLLFIIGGFLFLKNVYAEDVSTTDKQAEEEKLEKQKKEVKGDIKELNKKLKKKTKQKEKLEQDLTKVKNAVYYTKKDIDNTQAEIDKVEETIKRKEEELKRLESDKNKKREMLKKMIQAVYTNSQQPFLYIIFEKDSFIENVSNVDSFLRMKERILKSIKNVKENQDLIDKEKKELAEAKEKKDKLLALKISQKRNLERQQVGLQVEVREKMASIEKIRSKLATLKNDLNRILGKSYNTGDVKDAIKFASKSTGVRKGFLFGMLSVESRLGASVGSCNYKESRMSSYRKSIFKSICKKLGYNYKKKKVSCPPRSYKGTGGAMGAAQFMPDTWKGYESQIASHTGHNPPDPWNLVDGVMAMALKLKNDGATEKGKVRITSPCTGKKIKIKWEEYASMKYLGWSCYGLTHYAKTVQSLSGNYNKL